MEFQELILKIQKTGEITEAEFITLMDSLNEETREILYRAAREVQQRYFGNEIYLRGLIEISNYCRNDCYYCGIRRSNAKADRYHLNKEQILECTAVGTELGFQTFVLQGGEDLSYTDEMLCDIIREIKKQHPKCAVTLSIGEKSRESYQAYFDAGADRYLLRQETSNPDHYRVLHPDTLSLENRQRCLRDLKEIGYQVGCGFMVGSPKQELSYIYEDIVFMKQLDPHMIGIGPFLSHKDTPFSEEANGSTQLTIDLLALLRLLFPKALLPATTALGTADPVGREKGILAGANVVMPNLSPEQYRGKYLLYDGKICNGNEAAEAVKDLAERMERIGYQVVFSRGDHPDFC